MNKLKLIHFSFFVDVFYCHKKLRHFAVCIHSISICERSFPAIICFNDASTEFNTSDITGVGKSWTQKNLLNNFHRGHDKPFASTAWKLNKSSQSPLAGVWRINKREQNGAFYDIPEAARKTIKILTDTHFQWVAINTQTGEFFGTGGGLYSYHDGIYTEKIQFFSRDSSRIGASLSFKGAVKNNEWDHQGKSSKGDPIHEIWIKME